MLPPIVILIVAMLEGTPLAQTGTTPPMTSGGRGMRQDQMTIVSGTLTGTVRDKSRALVPGLRVTIRLESDANVAPHRTTTDKEGRFRFTGLPLGAYCLVVEQPGVGPTRRDGIQVRGAQESNVPIVLGEPQPTPTPGAPPRRPCS
jgi:hypothetical protein